jgi:hypothetical protein
MSTNFVEQAPFLRTSRAFPEDAAQLPVELTRAYVDIAGKVNTRTIGVYAVNHPAITGNNFFFSSQRNQSFRQLYSFGAIAKGTSLSIKHGITSLTQFISITGTCITDFPDYRPLPYVSNTNATDQIVLRVDTASASIVISNGATSANIISGLVILEWVGNV